MYVKTFDEVCGARCQTRTGTTRGRQILSLLCLPFHQAGDLWATLVQLDILGKGSSAGKSAFLAKNGQNSLSSLRRILKELEYKKIKKRGKNKKNKGPLCF